jgi:probable phosphoglycerate mutase
MTTIFLVRHAEAEGNLYRRIHGHYDSLVTVRGKKQIAQLEKRFSCVPVDFVYTSDLHRTRATAGAITAASGAPLFETPQLREVDMGAWEDHTWGEIERFEPEQLYWFNNDPIRWRISGSEDFDTLRRRLTTTITGIAERHDGKTAAIVSHGAAIRAFLSGLMNVPSEEIGRVKHSDNTAVALLHYDGYFSIDYFGDNTHLPEELSTFAHQKWWKENTTFDSTNLRYVPFDLASDAERYLAFRRDAWEVTYGTLPADLNRWLAEARHHAGAHQRAVSLALIGDTPVGMVELDIKNGEAEKAGVIELLYMIRDQRRTGIAVQLLGQAVSVYRSLGREKLRMTVSRLNEQTLGFCSKYGFERTGEVEGSGGSHIVVELNIKVE